MANWPYWPIYLNVRLVKCQEVTSVLKETSEKPFRSSVLTFCSVKTLLHAQETDTKSWIKGQKTKKHNRAEHFHRLCRMHYLHHILKKHLKYKNILQNKCTTSLTAVNGKVPEKLERPVALTAQLFLTHDNNKSRVQTALNRPTDQANITPPSQSSEPCTPTSGSK